MTSGSAAKTSVAFNTKLCIKGAAHRNPFLLRCAAPLIHVNALKLQTFWRLCRWSLCLELFYHLIINLPQV